MVRRPGGSMSSAAMVGKVFVMVHHTEARGVDNPDGLTAQERAAIVTALLHDGARLTTAEIAARCSMSARGALHMLTNLARVLPIFYDDGLWQWLTDDLSSNK